MRGRDRGRRLSWFRATATALWLLATAATVAVVLATTVPLWRLTTWLGVHAGIGYAAWLVATMVAPGALAVAGWLTRRTPWPWVVVASIEVLGATALVARLAHLAPWWMWAWWVAVTATGVASLATVGRQSS